MGLGGAPSTIVDFTRYEEGEVLRRGAISGETLRETAPSLRDLTGVAQDLQEGPSSGSGPNGEGLEPNGEASGPNLKAQAVAITAQRRPVREAECASTFSSSASRQQ